MDILLNTLEYTEELPVLGVYYDEDVADSGRGRVESVDGAHGEGGIELAACGRSILVRGQGKLANLPNGRAGYGATAGPSGGGACEGEQAKWSDGWVREDAGKVKWGICVREGLNGKR